MFRSIVAKELLDTAKSLRFTIGWLVMLVLMVSAVLLLSQDVRERNERLELVERGREEYISNYAHTNRINNIIFPQRPPEQEEVLFRGLESDSENRSFFSDPLRKLFGRFDLLSVISILLSLLAIIFTYDAICGEREEGTLKLIQVNSVSRATVVTAKWTGILLALGLPFLAVYMLSILLGSVLGGLSLSLENLLGLGAIAVAALTYIGFFLALGLLASALTRHPGTSILSLLFLWVIFVLAVPNAAPILASGIRPIPSVNAVERQASALTDTLRDNRLVEEADRKIAELRAEYDIPSSFEFSFRNELTADRLVQLGWDRERAQEFVDMFSLWFRETVERVNAEQREAVNELYDELNRRIDAQQELSRLISLLSPTPSFTYFCTDTATIGMRGEEYFYEVASEYSRTFHSYLEARQAAEEERLGRRIGANEFIDIADYPRFSYSPEPVGDRLFIALPYAGHLAGMTLVVLLLAVVAYWRYDIR